jgi:Ca-activated chloride channel family protein
VLALVFVTPFAHASAWDSLWARPDQRAAQALRDGDYAQAGKLASDPQLKGAAAYREGDYANAQRYFAQGDNARSEYDLGNALAKSGQYQRAIAAYDRALQRDPGFADARANREAVANWLKQHPPQSRQPGDQGTQGKPSGPPQKGSGSSSQGSQQGARQNGQGSGNDAKNQRAQAGGVGNGHPSDAQNADSAAGKAPNGGQGAGDSGASAKEDAQQRAQVARARQALKQEMAGRQPSAAGGRTSRDTQGAYALGSVSSNEVGKFNPQQRAMLNAVPDDPGALLRRKFMLEWQRRHGQQPDEDQ